MKDEVFLELIIGFVAVFDGDESVDSLTGKLIIDTNNGSLGDGMVLDECSFDFGSGETVTGYVDDIVDSASDPVIAFVITSSSVTCELRECQHANRLKRPRLTYVVSWVHVQICVHISLVCTPDCASH